MGPKLIRSPLVGVYERNYALYILQLGHSGHDKQEKPCRVGGRIGPGMGTEGGRHMGANGLLPSTTMLNFAIFCHFWVLIVVHKA